MRPLTDLPPGAVPASSAQLPMAQNGSVSGPSGDHRLTSLRAEHARLSARAAQARGRGEWALAAQVASQMAALDAVRLSAQLR